MATQTDIRLVDDLDGESEATETVSFGIDGKEMVIDLSDEHAAALRQILAPYVAAGRRAGRHRHAATSSRRDPSAVRSWLSDHGHVVPSRGRLSADLLDAYDNRREGSSQPVDEVVD